MKTVPFRGLWATSFLILALVGLVGVSAAPPDAPTNTKAADVELGQQLISPQKLKMHLNFIASDELQGRATPSPGLDLAARYIASHVEYFGYQPAGDDGSYYQKIPMSRRKTSKESMLRLKSGDKMEEFKIGVDFVGVGSELKGQLVFAGYGAGSKEAEYDDYDGLDVKGKLVVVFDGFPAGMDANQFKVEQQFGNRTMRTMFSKYRVAQNHGAVGAITIKGLEYTTPAGDKPSAFEQALPRLERESTGFDFQMVASPLEIDVTAAAGERLGKLLGLDLAGIKAKIDETKKPQPTNIDASFEAEIKPEIIERLSTQNVVAFLEGSDPKLKEEIVAFSAHYDHIGVSFAQPGGQSTKDGKPVDRIFNGADDDGSGTVGILNLAEAFAAVSRPKRSLLFVWHAGEERGLIGSDYFVRHPTKPLDKIASLINIDMIGRNLDDKDENANHVYLVGTQQTSKDLNEIIHKITGDRMRLDLTDPKNYFRRSDHFNYARNKIPVAFFCTGEHKDYHRVSDEVQLIMFDKMKKILDIVLECGLDLANRDTRPAFTGQGF